MPKTLLQIVQAAQAELGLPLSPQVVGSTDATTVQMFYLANRALDDLRREHNWTVLDTEFDLIVNPPIQTTGDITLNSPVITNIPSTSGLKANYFTVSGNAIPIPARIKSVNSGTQVTLDMVPTGTLAGAPLTFCQDTYALPPDLDFYQNQTMWDRTNRWALFGPDSPQTSQWYQSGIVPITPRRHFRQIGPPPNQWRIWPPPAEIANPLQLVFEYASLYAVSSPSSANTGDFSSADFGADFSTGFATSYSQYFEHDNDVPLLDDQAIILGLKWRMWEIKGFNYQFMQSNWIDYVNRLKARDGAAPTLRISRRPTSILISPANIQDGNFPSNVSTGLGN